MSKTTKAPINPKILEWCIQDFNISIEDVAKKVGTSKEKVQSWLEEKDSPTYNQAENLAYKVFKKPLAIFFMPEVPVVMSFKKKFRSLPDYLYDSTSYKTRLAINKADFFRTVLFEIFKKNPSAEPIFKTIKVKDIVNPNEVATEIRNKIGISLEVQKKFTDRYKAFNYYRSKLEENGIFTFQLKLEGDRAFCLIDDEFPIIILNSGDSINSKIFSLFHELVHILIGKEDIFKEVESPIYFNDPVEIFCNAVASEVLIPVKEFKNIYVNNISVWNEDIIQRVANDYSVSKEVILRKLLDLGIKSSDTYEDCKKKWDEAYKQKKTGGGNFYLNKVSALGKGYTNKVIDNYRSGIINDIQVSSFLDIKYSQLPGIESKVYSL